DFILLFEREISVELVALGAEFRLRRALPVHFEEWAGNVRHPQLVLFQNPPGFFNLFRIQFEQVLVPHAAQFDPVHAELFGGDFASTAEILRDFIVDDGNPERRIHTVTPSFSSRYFLLMAPDSFGVRALSGTTSSSTIAQPRKFTLCKAANAAGRSTRPLPNSTKRKGRFAFAPLGAGSSCGVCCLAQRISAAGLLSNWMLCRTRRAL